MEAWQAIQNILNWMLIEDIIRKVTNNILDEDTKILGLKKLGKKYGDALYEMAPDEIEKELVGIYLEIMKKDNKYIETPKAVRKAADEEQEEKDFMEELDERAKVIPELQYFNQMMKKNPEFKKIVKRLRLPKNDDEDEDSDESQPDSSMYI